MSYQVRLGQPIAGVEYVRPLEPFRWIENYFWEDVAKLPNLLEIVVGERVIQVYGLNPELAFDEIKRNLSSISEPVILRSDLFLLLNDVALEELHFIKHGEFALDPEELLKTLQNYPEDVAAEASDTLEKILTLPAAFHDYFISLNLLKPRLGERLYRKMFDRFVILWKISIEKVEILNRAIKLWDAEKKFQFLQEGKDYYYTLDEISPYLPLLKLGEIPRLEQLKRALRTYFEVAQGKIALEKGDLDLLCPLEEMFEPKKPFPEALEPSARRSLENFCMDLHVRVEFTYLGQRISLGALRNKNFCIFMEKDPDSEYIRV